MKRGELVDEPPLVGGSICKAEGCGWECDDPGVQQCKRCGSWCRFWLTDEDTEEGRRSARAWADLMWNHGLEERRRQRGH